MPPDLYIVAEVLRPHGLRGDLVLRPATDHLETILSAREVYLGTGAEQPTRVVAARMHKGAPLLRLEGVDSSTSAEALRGQAVCLPRQALRPLAEGEFFLHDLVGLTVVASDGSEVGRVEWVLEAGAAPVLVGKRPDGREFMVPFADATVREVDLASRRLALAPLDGLLDDAP